MIRYDSIYRKKGGNEMKELTYTTNFRKDVELLNKKVKLFRIHDFLGFGFALLAAILSIILTRSYIMFIPGIVAGFGFSIIISAVINFNKRVNVARKRKTIRQGLAIVEEEIMQNGIDIKRGTLDNCMFIKRSEESTTIYGKRAKSFQEKKKLLIIFNF